MRPASSTGRRWRSSSSLPQDVSATEHTAKWANWTAYLDFDDKTKKYPTLEAFKKKTGMAVTYSEDIDDNDSYFNKIAPQLRAGQDIDRDIFVFTDWMANRVIREKLCQPLELIRMPHAANLLDKLKDVSFDPGPAVLPDLAERVRRDRLRQGQGRSRPEDHRRPVGPRPQGQDRGPQRVPRHHSA